MLRKRRLRKRHLGFLVAPVALAVAVSVGVTPALAESPPLEPGNSKMTDPEETTWQGIEIPTQGVLPKREQHPSLLFGSDDVARLRDRAAGKADDPRGFYASRWQRIKRDADAAVDRPVSDNDNDKTRAASALAFAWTVTGEQRYRDAAVANLKAAYSHPQDDKDLYIGLQLTNYALAYDWVAGDGISGADDAAMRSAIRWGAQWLRDYLDRPGVRPHNHRSKAALALGLWALAASSEPEAADWLDAALDSANRVFRYQFTQDGVYREGGYYWIFTLINLAPFMHAYRNVSGVDLFTPLRPAFEASLKISTPEGWLPNVEDGWYKNTWLVTAAGAYRNARTPLSRSGTLGQLFQWRFFDSDWETVRYDDNFTGARDQYYGWTQEFVLYDSAIAERKPDQAAATVDMNAGPRGGVTVFRNNWNRGDHTTRWAYFNGVAMSDNHDHADGLQFVIHAENSVLAYDSGYGPGRFSKRADWVGPDRHNVVTADGAAVGDPTPTRHFLNTPGFGFAEKSAAYWNDQDARATRAVAFVGGDYFVVSDQLSAATEKTWAHGYRNRGALTGGDGRWTWTTAPGPWGEAASMHSLLLPRSADTNTVADGFNGYGDNSYVDGDPYPDPSTDLEDTTALRSEQTGTQAQYLQVLVPRPVAGATPELEDLSDGGVLGARVTSGDTVDTFLTQPESALATVGDLAARATWAWSRVEGGTAHGWTMRDGTELRLGDRLLARASAPISATGDLSDQRRTSVQIAETDASYTLRLAGPAGSRPVAAFFNDQPVEFSGAAETASVSLRGGGDLRIVWGR